MSERHHGNGKSKKSYSFHPNEIAVVGFSGSGKTTLIEKLTNHWSNFEIAYLKHDAHRFDIDHPGKDTHRIAQAGAKTVVISDAERSAVVFQKAMIGVQKAEDSVPESLLSLRDLLIVEGYKDLAIPQIVVIDAERRIFDRLAPNQPGQRRIYVGKAATSPDPVATPYFQRDDVVSIADAAMSLLLERTRYRGLNGLVLAGGKSTRMGQDKGLLRYGAKSQIEACTDLLTPFCKQVFLSGRSGQWRENEIPHAPRIEDRFLDMGPLGGILSAMSKDRESAWLVVAVDMPHLTDEAVGEIVKRRDPFKFATVFAAKPTEGLKHLIEPLCGIYEPKCYGKFLEYISQDRTCPASILSRLPIRKLDPNFAEQLSNVNYPEERDAALTKIGGLP